MIIHIDSNIVIFAASNKVFNVIRIESRDRHDLNVLIYSCVHGFSYEPRFHLTIENGIFSWYRELAEEEVSVLTLLRTWYLHNRDTLDRKMFEEEEL